MSDVMIAEANDEALVDPAELDAILEVLAQVLPAPVDPYRVEQAAERLNVVAAYQRVRELETELEEARAAFDLALIDHLALSPMGARRLGRLLGVSKAAAGFMLRIARGEVLEGRRRVG